MSAESFACEWCGDQLHHHEPMDEQFCAGQLAAWKRIVDAQEV